MPLSREEMKRAHPRSRGENRLDARPHGLNTGLIPAHAGKTSVQSTKTRLTTAHPRSRGENT